MSELADIFIEYGAAYRAKFGHQMLPSHHRVMRAIKQCRTEALGGRVYHCQSCDEDHYRYHSCRNRHCPKCQNGAAESWLAQQSTLLLPVPYFFVTFTLPSQLRPLAKKHQKVIYNLLFRASAAATQQLAADPRFVGGRIGMIGVLQTWARDLTYHPHVHYLVPGGGMTEQGWRLAKNDFLVHVKPLSILFRAKFRDGLKEAGLFDQVPAEIWSQPWVVHSQPSGNGKAVLKYLAPYVFRVALSNNRILKVADGQVTFCFQDSKSGKKRTLTLTAEAFIHRFLQHVLPKGFVKIRYYGFLSSGNRPRLRQLQALLGLKADPFNTDPVAALADDLPICPKCGELLVWVKRLEPPRNRSP